MKTDIEINKLAAEAMGMCWHNDIEVFSNEFTVMRRCGKCLQKVPVIGVVNPDFVNDLNAAQRLMKFAIDQRDELVIEVCLEAFVNLYSVCNILTAPPKTITLAALVALDKLTLEEAKEILK